MSQQSSPSRFSSDYETFFDPNFTADISQKMRVPKRIKVNGDNDDDQANGHVNWNSVLVPDKFDMRVPDRILVVGQEQHMGTRAPPRELILENSVMPPDPGMIRVQTPPRILTLDDHYFPTADDFEARTRPDSPTERTNTLVRPKPRLNMDQRLMHRESTPPLGGGGEVISTSEEIVHLRRQLAKLNRRVMSVELDNLQRQQREKVLYVIGLAYLFLKTIFWINRSS